MFVDYKQLLRQLCLKEPKTHKEQRLIDKLSEWDNNRFVKECREMWEEEKYK